MNVPLAFFALRIGGDRVEVELAPPRGADPGYWTPSITTIEALQQADLIVLNGAGHERWRDKVSLPASKVVNSAEAFRDRWIETDEGVTHSHGGSGVHSHKGSAFTTWLDPTLAIEQAEAVRSALIRLRPSDAAAFDAAFDALRAELLEIDADLERAIHGQQGLPILFSHPVYQYLERRFALNARSLHWEPLEMPDDDEWRDLATLLREHPARWMVWESEPTGEIRDRLRALGIEVVVYRPAGNVGDDVADPSLWLEIQRENAAALARIYE